MSGERRGGLYWCCAVDVAVDARFLVLSPEAFRLWVLGNCYARAQGTDGWIPRVALVTLTRSARPSRLVDELLAGVPGYPRPALWAVDGGGWRIAEWARLNVSAAEIDRKRESQRVRMQILRALAPYPDGLTEDQLGQVDPSVRTYLELRPDGRWHRRRLSDRELTVSAQQQSQSFTVSERDRDRGRSRGRRDGEEGQSPPPPASHPEFPPPTAPPEAVAADREATAPELPGMPPPAPVEPPPKRLTATQEAQRRVAEALAAAQVAHPGPSVVQLWLEEARKDVDLVVRVIRDCHGAGRLSGVAMPTAYLFAAVRSAAAEAAAAAKGNGHATGAGGAGGAERAHGLRQAEVTLSRLLHLQHPQLRQEAERHWAAMAAWLKLPPEASAATLAEIRFELYGEAA